MGDRYVTGVGVRYKDIMFVCLRIYDCITLSERESVSEREGEIEMCVWSMVCIRVCVVCTCMCVM